MRTLTIALAFLAMAVCVGCKEKSTVKNETGGKLTLTAPADVKIERGGTAEVKVRISREKLEGPVTVSFAKLPDGVEAIGTEVKIDKDEGLYLLKAATTAPLVSDNVSDVTATGPDGAGVTENFKITVIEKK